MGCGQPTTGKTFGTMWTTNSPLRLWRYEQVLDRGEKIELLVDKTDYLQHESFTFKREARRLKSKMYWRNVRMTLLIVFAVLLVIYIIICFTCGPTFRCVRS